MIRKTVRWIGLLLAAWLVFIVLCGILPPLHHPGVSESSRTAAALRLEAPAENTGERILNIETNPEALIWRLRAIEAAQDRIILSTFDFDDDGSGRDVMAALQAAARRGVKIQIIIDGINGLYSWISGPALHALAVEPNVEMRFYNPINLFRPWQLSYRLHDKYLIVDDFLYILGGRNTNDLFLGDYMERPNYDRDILVWRPQDAENSSGEDLEKYFDAVWTLQDNKRVGRATAKTARTAAELEAHYRTLPETYPEAFEPVDWEAVTHPVNSITLWTNPIGEESKAPELWKALYQRMQEGSDVLIQTPYIVCNREMYDDLARLSEGRRLRILTNAVANGANPFGCTDYLNNKKKILATGSEVFEVNTSISSHTKTILVDDRWSMVGSYNLDMRSTYLNTELMLMIDSPELNAELRGYMDELESRSNHVMPDGTETPGEKYTAVEPGLLKKLLYLVMRIITLPVRHLL